MINKTDSSPPSLTLKQVAKNFRLTGWISLWLQVALTLVSAIILLVFSPQTNLGVGVVLTVCSMLGLLFNIYWAWSRYITIGRRLQDVAGRPKRADVNQSLVNGLVASLFGGLLAMLGALSIVGLLAVKAANQSIGSFVNTDPSKMVRISDILVLQANMNVILAQFSAIAASLWLLNRLGRQ
jgi:Protein of unknown function (DUF3611)